MMLSGSSFYAQTSSKVVFASGTTRYLFECTTAGTTGNVQPSGIASGTITDNTAVWSYVATLPNTYTTTIKNNVIDLGNGLAGDIAIFGIAQEGAIANDISNTYHNSIYIGGVATGTTNNTAAFYHHAETAAPSIDLRNNILANNRKNGSQLAIYSDAYSALTTCDYNLYQYTGNFGAVGTTPTYLPDFASWQLNSSKDVHSYVSDPKFIDPTNSTLPNLQIMSTVYTDADAKGADLLSVVADDYNGTNRSLYSPNDIGAYVVINYSDVSEQHAELQNCLVYSDENNQINIHYVGDLSKDTRVTVVNTIGQTLHSQQLVNTFTTIESRLNSGIYLILIKSGLKSTTRKIIIN